MIWFRVKWVDNRNYIIMLDLLQRQARESPKGRKSIISDGAVSNNTPGILMDIGLWMNTYFGVGP